MKWNHYKCSICQLYYGDKHPELVQVGIDTDHCHWFGRRACRYSTRGNLCRSCNCIVRDIEHERGRRVDEADKISSSRKYWANIYIVFWKAVIDIRTQHLSDEQLPVSAKYWLRKRAIDLS